MIIHLGSSDTPARLRYCLPTPRYVPNESAYSIFSRFAQANVLTGAEVVKIIKRDRVSRSVAVPSGQWLHRMDSVDSTRAAQAIEVPQKEFTTLFLFPTFIRVDGHVDKFLKFCPSCLAQGCHYTIFQYALIQHCPIHNHVLKRKCPSCSATIEYRLRSALFRTPFGCPNCGMRLAEPVDSRTIHFISSASLTRLDNAHAVFQLSRSRTLEFSVGAGKEVYYDNALQLSHGEGKFYRQECRLFTDLQKIASGEFSKPLSLLYPRHCMNEYSSTDSGALDVPVFVHELNSMVKSVFRNIIKQERPEARLTSGLVWRSPEGRSILSNAYDQLAILDWYSFWLGTDVPGLRYGRFTGPNTMLSNWVSEQLKHPAFKRLTVRGQKWLLSRILGAEILARLNHQMGVRPAVSETDIFGRRMFKYERKILPVLWAALFLHTQNKGVEIAFVSAADGQKIGPSVTSNIHGPADGELLSESHFLW